MKRARFLILIAALIGMVRPAAALDPIELPNDGQIEFYGQLSPAHISFDDGRVTTRSFADNSNSNSRLGLWYRQPLRGGGTFRFNAESAFGFAGTNLVNQSFKSDDWTWTKSDIRKFEVILETERFGTLYAGQGSMASDGVANVDLSGTSIVSYVGIPDSAGAFQFRTQAGLLSLVTVAQAFPNYDGGRRARLRYDSPRYRGFVLSVSAGEQLLSDISQTKDSDITLRYDLETDRFRLQAAGGYTWIDRQTLSNNRTGIGSFSIEHKPTGLSFTMSAGTRDTAGNYRYFKLGYKAGHTRVGPFSVSLDYYGANNMVSAGSRSASYGFGLLQRFSNPRTEAYLGLRHYEFSDLSGLKYSNAQSVLIGARWKF